jgi:hypothetical protein
MHVGLRDFPLDARVRRLRHPSSSFQSYLVKAVPKLIADAKGSSFEPLREGANSLSLEWHLPFLVPVWKRSLKQSGCRLLVYVVAARMLGVRKFLQESKDVA